MSILQTVKIVFPFILSSFKESRDNPWMKKTIALLTLILISSFNTYSNIDLSNRFGPVRDQGTSGFCHAFVTADLLGEYFNLPPRHISALDLALGVSVHSPHHSIYANFLGFNKSTTKDQVHHPHTGARALLPRETHELNLTQRGNFVEWSIVASTGVLNEGLCLEAELPSEKENDKNYINKLVSNEINNFLKPGLTFSRQEIEDINEQAAKSIRQKCTNRWKAPHLLPNIITLSQMNSKKMVNEAKSILDTSRPIGVKLDAKIIDGTSTGAHAMIIVGYRQGQKTLWFKLRNSWGENCAGSFNCERGYNWVSREALTEGIHSITWL
jgi:hypothetical protein